MRRINSNRTKSISQQRSHGCNERSAMFRKSECKRGHSLMRRTELSWEKLQQVSSPRTEATPNLPSSSQNDYFIRETPLKPAKQPLGLKQERIGCHNVKTKFCQRINLFPRRSSKKNIQNGYNVQSQQKCYQQRSPFLQKKPFLSQKQIRHPPVHKRKRKYHLPLQTLQEETKQLYQMQFIPENAKKRSTSRKIQIPQIKQFTQHTPSQTYQLYNIPPSPIPSSPKLQEVSSASIYQPRMEAINKTKQQQSTMSTLKNSILPLFSRKCSTISNSDSTSNKITLHLEIVAELAQYSKQLLEMYEESNDWEELAFLTYKKYYLERLKVARALRGIGQNPFQLSVYNLTHEEVQGFRKRLEGIKLAKQIEAENRKFVNSLRNFYNLIIEKSGNHINMEERDDFTGEILRDMKVQIDLLMEIDSEEAKKRMARVYRCAYLISELSGHRIISYEESLDMDPGNYLNKAASLFHQCLIL